MKRNLKPLNKKLNKLVDFGNNKVEKLNKLYVQCKFDEADKYFCLLDTGEWDEKQEDFVYNCDDSLVNSLTTMFDEAMEYLKTLDQQWLHSIGDVLDTNIENQLRKWLKLNVYSVPGAQSSHSWTNEVVEECLQSYRSTMLDLYNMCKKRNSWV